MPEKPLITEATIIQTKGGAITVPENSIAIVNDAGTLKSQTPDGTLATLGGGSSTVNVTAPITGNGTSGSPIAISAATGSAPGSMSAADKTKLNGISIPASAGIVKSSGTAFQTATVDSANIGTDLSFPY